MYVFQVSCVPVVVGQASMQNCDIKGYLKYGFTCSPSAVGRGVYRQVMVAGQGESLREIKHCRGQKSLTALGEGMGLQFRE